MGQRAQPAPVVAQQPSSPKLVDRVRAAIRARHHSLRTEEAYVGWIRRFIVFHHKRHPAEMGEPEINQFLTHLAVAGNVAASTQNQALSAILFLYERVLERGLAIWMALSAQKAHPSSRGAKPGGSACPARTNVWHAKTGRVVLEEGAQRRRQQLGSLRMQARCPALDKSNDISGTQAR